MALNIITISPDNNSTSVGIDEVITIEFDQEIDPFTVLNGISLYTLTEAEWTGPDLASLDSKYSDVLDIGSEYTFYPLEITITGNTVKAKPTVSMIPNKKHFVQVLPGNDATRYVVAKTTADPVYTRSGVSTGTVSVAGAYTGKDNVIYQLSITGNTTLDVLKGSDYIGSFTYTEGEPVDTGDLIFIITGQFDDTDLITVDAFAAQGVASVVKIAFTTTAYITTSPTSNRITSVSQITNPLRVVSITPTDMSINNTNCNPIVVKFDKAIDTTQDIRTLIKITKTDIETGRVRNVVFNHMINGNILKLFMVGVQ